MAALSVRAARRVRGHLQSYAEGRVCVEPDCLTTLSRYNADDLCWRHAEARDAIALRRPR
jgi:hypothetical protein